MITSGDIAEIARQAKDLISETTGDLQETQKRIDEAIFPLALATKRGTPGDWLIRETGRRWRETTASPIRISFDGPIGGKSFYAYEELRPTPSTFVIGERALQMASMMWEPGFTICRLLVSLERRTLRRSIEPIIELSLYALCDRAANGRVSVTEALGDLSYYHRWLPALRETQSRSMITLPCQDGFWQGFTVEMGPRSYPSAPLVAIHGWRADETVRDAQAKQLLSLFRSRELDSSARIDLINEITQRVIANDKLSEDYWPS